MAMGIQGKKEQTEGENIDALINTFTKEEMHGMIEIIDFLKLKNPPHSITKEQASSLSVSLQEDQDKTQLHSRSKLGLGLSKSDHCRMN